MDTSTALSLSNFPGRYEDEILWWKSFGAGAGVGLGGGVGGVGVERGGTGSNRISGDRKRVRSTAVKEGVKAEMR